MWLSPLHEAWTVKTEEREGAGKWMRAQEDERQGHLEKKMLDPEDHHLECKEMCMFGN